MFNAGTQEFFRRRRGVFRFIFRVIFRVVFRVVFRIIFRIIFRVDVFLFPTSNPIVPSTFS